MKRPDWLTSQFWTCPTWAARDRRETFLVSVVSVAVILFCATVVVAELWK